MVLLLRDREYGCPQVMVDLFNQKVLVELWKFA